MTYSRNFGGRLNLPETSLGDLGSALTIQGAPSLPQITVGGFFTLTNSIGGPRAATNFYSINDPTLLHQRQRNLVVMQLISVVLGFCE